MGKGMHLDQSVRAVYAYIRCAAQTFVLYCSAASIALNKYTYYIVRTIVRSNIANRCTQASSHEL